MRTLLILVLLGSTVARAQPGQTDPVPAGEPQGYYAQRPMVQLQITEEQAGLLSRGQIPIGRYITGGILSYVVGFGIGHAVQGRWNDQGWVFTAGESASMVAIIYGIAQMSGRHGFDQGPDQRQRRGENYLVAGLVGLVGFRVWEVVDAWVAPPIHNRKVRALEQQLGLAPPTYGFYLAPPHDSDAAGGVAGLALSF